MYAVLTVFMQTLRLDLCVALESSIFLDGNVYAVLTVFMQTTQFKNIATSCQSQGNIEMTIRMIG